MGLRKHGTTIVYLMVHRIDGFQKRFEKRVASPRRHLDFFGRCRLAPKVAKGTLWTDNFFHGCSFLITDDFGEKARTRQLFLFFILSILSHISVKMVTRHLICGPSTLLLLWRERFLHIHQVRIY